MASSSIFLLAAATVMVGLSITVSESQLAYNHYESTCPNVEAIVKESVLTIMLGDVTAPAGFLRLMFHDCQVQGCDASILLDSEGSNAKPEIASSMNFGIRMREKIGEIKSILEAECPGQVSCADIIALAARDAVALSGGPLIQIPVGRKDSITSSYHLADVFLPPPYITVDTLLDIFTSKGMNLEESVAILGAHTVGVGHCRNIVGRLYDPKPGDQMDMLFKTQLTLTCPTPIPLTNLTVMSNDQTPTLFDNHYFRDILTGRGLFAIDSNISRDPRTKPIVGRFAFDQNYYFQVFSSAFVKLSSTGVLSRKEGEVRRQCNRRNL